MLHTYLPSWAATTGQLVADYHVDSVSPQPHKNIKKLRNLILGRKFQLKFPSVSRVYTFGAI
jgi:hypothetical protein